MTDVTDRVVFLDLETTGLDPHCDMILEVAVVVAEFVPLDGTYCLPVPLRDANGEPTSDYVARKYVLDVPGAASFMDAHVREMHTMNGLLFDVRRSSVSRRMAEDRLCRFLQEEGFQRGKTTLAGSSVHFDLSFLKVHMPKLAAFFHHRLLDVSAFRVLAERVVAPDVGKRLQHLIEKTQHRAYPDCLGSINELSIYLQHFISPGAFWENCLKSLPGESE